MCVLTVAQRETQAVEKMVFTRCACRNRQAVIWTPASENIKQMKLDEDVQRCFATLQILHGNFCKLDGRFPSVSLPWHRSDMLRTSYWNSKFASKNICEYEIRSNNKYLFSMPRCNGARVQMYRSSSSNALRDQHPSWSEMKASMLQMMGGHHEYSIWGRARLEGL